MTYGITMRKPSELVPYAKNSRTHSAEQVKQVMRSIEEFGFTNPILTHGKTIIAGHCRLEAAKKLGYTEVPTIALDGLTIEQARAYVIADNKLALNAGWDDGVLKDEIESLLSVDYAIDLLGFTDEELQDLGVGVEEPEDHLGDPDGVPEVPQNIHGVKRGDVWQLGEHRLMCGDSTKESDVAKLMNGQKADMVFTDPPYGISYKGGSKQRKEIDNDAIAVLPFYEEFLVLAKRHSKAGAAIYIWHASSETHNCINAAINSGWLFKSYLIWVKNNSTFGRSDYHWQHEPAFYGWGSDGTHKWYGDRKQTTTWMIDRPSRSEDHPTMKPVELCEIGITNSSQAGHSILEPFCGSGSTLIACEKTGRKCYGMELDEHYCSIIIERWQQFTNKKAIRLEGE